MKNIRAALVIAVAATIASAGGAMAQAPAGGFQLSSVDVKNSTFAPAQIFNGFGCTGNNVSPQLSWKGAPQGTKSFVVTLYDPDAPTGSGFWHWVVINLPASVTTLPTGVSRSGKLPPGAIETRTDFGQPGYGGPCPPAGDKPHRYVFTVLALKADKLDLDAQASGAMVGFAAHGNTLGTATFTARYGR